MELKLCGPLKFFQTLAIIAALSGCGSNSGPSAPGKTPNSNSSGVASTGVTGAAGGGNVVPAGGPSGTGSSTTTSAVPTQPVDPPAEAQALMAKIDNTAVNGGDRIKAMVDLKDYKFPAVRNLYLKIVKEGVTAIPQETLLDIGDFTASLGDLASRDPYDYALQLGTPFTTGDVLFLGREINLSSPGVGVRARVLAAQLLAQQGPEGIDALLNFAVTTPADSAAAKIVQLSAVLEAAKYPDRFTKIVDLVDGDEASDAGLSGDTKMMAAIGLGRGGTLSQGEISQLTIRFEAETDLSRRRSLVPALAQNTHLQAVRTALLQFAGAAPAALAEQVAVLLGAPTEKDLSSVDSFSDYRTYWDNRVNTLAQIGSPACLRSLERMGNRAEFDYSQAIDDLGTIKTLASAQWLVSLLHNDQKDVKDDAFSTLKSMNTPEADAMLLNITWSSDEFASDANVTLQTRSVPQKQAAYRALLKMPNMDDQAIQSALAWLSGDDRVALIAGFLADTSRSNDLRHYAKDLLSEIGTPEALAAIAAHPLNS